MYMCCYAAFVSPEDRQDSDMTWTVICSNNCALCIIATLPPRSMCATNKLHRLEHMSLHGAIMTSVVINKVLCRWCQRMLCHSRWQLLLLQKKINQTEKLPMSGPALGPSLCWWSAMKQQQQLPVSGPALGPSLCWWSAMKQQQQLPVSGPALGPSLCWWSAMKQQQQLPVSGPALGPSLCWWSAMKQQQQLPVSGPALGPSLCWWSAMKQQQQLPVSGPALGPSLCWWSAMKQQQQLPVRGPALGPSLCWWSAMKQQQQLSGPALDPSLCWSTAATPSEWSCLGSFSVLVICYEATAATPSEWSCLGSFSVLVNSSNSQWVVPPWILLCAGDLLWATGATAAKKLWKREDKNWVPSFISTSVSKDSKWLRKEWIWSVSWWRNTGKSAQIVTQSWSLVWDTAVQASTSNCNMLVKMSH